MAENGLVNGSPLSRLPWKPYYHHTDPIPPKEMLFKGLPQDISEIKRDSITKVIA